MTTGPIFGRKTFAAKSDAAARELAILTEAGLAAQSFEGFGKLVQGTRRHNLVYVEDLAYDVEPEGVAVAAQVSAPLREQVSAGPRRAVRSAGPTPGRCALPTTDS